MRLHEHIVEIIDIAKKNRVELKKAAPMFMTNCTRGEEIYMGAEGVDWKDYTNDVATLTSSILPFTMMVNTIGDKLIELHEAGKDEECRTMAENYN